MSESDSNEAESLADVDSDVVGGDVVGGPQAATAQVDSEPAKDQPLESVPDYQPQTVKPAGTNARRDMKRFGGVQVALTAQLGRAHVTIEEMMGLGEGTVLELDREISEPVELVAHGVPLGNGEVVVVDDRFAIRVKEIYQT